MGVETCKTCRHIETKKRTRKFEKTHLDKKIPVHYCRLSGAEVLSVLKGCLWWNKPI
jgi:hypothetical protein